MVKKLKEMTKEELWELFPIILSEHNPVWKQNFLTEKAVIEEVVGIENIQRLSHIGSTAVTGLKAKPTVDILLEIKEGIDTEKLVTEMKAAGYGYSPQPDKPAPHMMFMKGYTPDGFKDKVFHVHVRYNGDWDELYFRDYLISHPKASDEYGRLKHSLMKIFKYDRDRYTIQKTDFISKITKLSRKEIPNKYKPLS